MAGLKYSGRFGNPKFRWDLRNFQQASEPNHFGFARNPTFPPFLFSEKSGRFETLISSSFSHSNHATQSLAQLLLWLLFQEANELIYNVFLFCRRYKWLQWLNRFSNLPPKQSDLLFTFWFKSWEIRCQSQLNKKAMYNIEFKKSFLLPLKNEFPFEFYDSQTQLPRSFAQVNHDRKKIVRSRVFVIAQTFRSKD